MRKLWSMHKGWAVGLAAFPVLVLALYAFGADPVDGHFAAFDSAKLVIGGVPPDTKAADLTSDCTVFSGGPPPTCNFATFTDSGVAFIPNAGHLPTLADITTLSTDYNVGGSDCGGGSPRFQINLDTGKNIFVYIGPVPNFTNCFYGWQNTGNVVNATDKRWDTSQLFGGTFYDTHADALTLAGSAHITSISVIVDGGWTTPRGQDVTIDNFTVNNKVMHAEDAFHH